MLTVVEEGCGLVLELLEVVEESGMSIFRA